MKNLVNNLTLVTTLGASILLAGCPGSGGSGGSSAAPAAAPSIATASGTTTAETATTVAAKTPSATTASPAAESLKLTLDQASLDFQDTTKSAAKSLTVNLLANVDTDISLALSTDATGFTLSQDCAKLKAGIKCPVTVTARANTTGEVKGTLTASIGGKAVGTVSLSANVKAVGVKKVVPLNGTSSGFGIVWQDGTASFWGSIFKSSTFSGASRALPNAAYLATLSASVLDGANNIQIKALPVVLPGNTKIVDMEWAGRVGCALDQSGDEFCWGLPQLVVGSTVTQTSVPTLVATGVKSLGAANDMKCFLKASDNTAWCLGNVDNGTHTNSYTDVNSAGSTWTNVPVAFAPGVAFDYLTVSNANILCGKVLGQEVIYCGGTSYSNNVFSIGDATVGHPFAVLPNADYLVSGPIKNVVVGLEYVCVQSNVVGCSGGGLALGGNPAAFFRQYRPALTFGSPLEDVTSIFPTRNGLGLVAAGQTYAVDINGILAPIFSDTGRTFGFAFSSTVQSGPYDIKATGFASTLTAYDVTTCTDAMTGDACN